MNRFVIEHLPRTPARYNVTPLDHVQAKAWIEKSEIHSLIRTTELIAAIDVGLGITLAQSDSSMSLRPGDEAVLISLSYGVLLASTLGDMPPLPQDWRFSLLIVEAPTEPVQSTVMEVVAESPTFPGRSESE